MQFLASTDSFLKLIIVYGVVMNVPQLLGVKTPLSWWVLGTELSLVSLCGKRFYVLSHLSVSG